MQNKHIPNVYPMYSSSLHKIGPHKVYIIFSRNWDINVKYAGLAH